MKVRQENRKYDAPLRSHPLLYAALAALALVVGTPRVVLAECWSITEYTTLDRDRTVECVEIAYGCKLDLNGYTLTLGGNGGGTSTIHGTLVLSGPNSHLRIKSNDHTMTGSGYLVGEHNWAVIDDHPAFPGDLIIASGFTVAGAMQIDLDLVNNGRVLADDGTTDTGSRNTLLLSSGTITGSGVWEVDKSIGAYTAFLEFGSGVTSATGLTGDFVVSDGTLYIDDVVSTSGGLCFTGGKIDVQANDSFTATGAPASCP